MEIVDVLLDSLKLPPDYKEDEDQVKAMAQSIKDRGLLQPITVKSDGTIVIGRKRVCAMRRLEWATAPCILMADEVSKDECHISSLHENLKRSNLPWHEQVILEKELHDLRQSQHGKGKQGKKVGWSLRDTARELDIALGSLSEDLRLAEALLSDPNLKKVGDKTTAKRVILAGLRLATQEAEARLPTDYPTNVTHHGSAEVVLGVYPNNFFDVCLTDPPWLEFKDGKLVKDEATESVFPEIYRTMKLNSFLYAFVSTQDWFVYHRILPKMGFRMQKWPLIWIKENTLTHGTRSWEYQRDFELVLLAVKGTPSLANSMLSAVSSCPIVAPSKRIHQNEKPTAVINRYIEHSTFEGSIILDPFAGSGVVGVAAKALGRRYVLIERDGAAHSNIVERLEE